MKTDTHRFNKCTGAGSEQSCGNDLLPRHNEILTHGTVALHTKRLVVLAGIRSAIATRGTLVAVGIGIEGDGHARFESLGHFAAHLHDGCAHLMTRYHGHLHHRVLTEECTEVRATESHIFHFQKHLSGLQFIHVVYFHERHLALLCYLYCFHILYSLIFFIYGNSTRFVKP